jgi:[CysO sulfur-carrier protein]-S-L-cysteine hydrolase
MPPAIIISSAHLETLARISDEARPNESCAFLLGSSDSTTVVEILQMNNADSSPYTFSIEPAELLKAYDTAEKRGLNVMGIFHSHPGKATPSPTDMKYMRLNPVAWLIYSSTEHDFAAYFGDDELNKVEIVIRD